MRTAWRAAAVIALVGALVGCGSESVTGGDTSSTATEVTDVTEVTSTVKRDVTLPEGFPDRIVLVTGNPTFRTQQVEVIDTATGDRRVLAEQSDLSSTLPVDEPRLASISSPALSPDGTSAVFGFGDRTRLLVRVPLDGSSPPEVLSELDGFLYGQSPDGRWRLVYDLDGVLRLVPADGAASPRPPGVSIPYPPAAAAWSSDGARVAVVDHWERTGPVPSPVVYAADLSTGELRPTGDQIEGSSAGFQWFDPEGGYHVIQRAPAQSLPILNGLAIDSTHRFVLGSRLRLSGGTGNGTSEPAAEFVWWNSSDEEPDPHPLDIGNVPEQGGYDGLWATW